MDDQPGFERLMWTRFEPIHAVTYFVPQALAAYEAAGLRGFWRGYFAGRAAPLGSVTAAPVIASFYGFAPDMVRRAVPDVWSRITPEQAVAARAAGAHAALSSMLAGQERTVAEAAELLDEVTNQIDCVGRVLGAANAALPRPADPLGRLWHATTVLREHRGDGHVAALVASGLSGPESVVWRAHLDSSRSRMQPARGWTDADWDAAMARLTERGWLTPDGRPTELALDEHGRVETTTDAAAAAPWRRLSNSDRDRLADLLYPLAVICADALPFPNPIGLPRIMLTRR